MCEECGLSIAEGKNLIGLWQEETGAMMDEYPSKEQLLRFKTAVRRGIDTSAESLQTPAGYASDELAERVAASLDDEIQARRAQQSEDIQNQIGNLSNGFVSERAGDEIKRLGYERGTLDGDYGSQRVIEKEKDDIEKSVYNSMSDPNVTQDVMGKAWKMREQASKPTATKRSRLGAILDSLTDNFDKTAAEDYMPYSNFFRAGRWVNSWLDELQNPAVRRNAVRKPLDSFTGKRAWTMTRDEAQSTAVEAYFSASDDNGLSYAYYPIPGTSEFISFRRYRDGEHRTDLGVPLSYKDVIIRKLSDTAVTEYNRIAEIRSGQRGRIPVFDDAGASFLYLPGLNDYTSSETSNHVTQEMSMLRSQERMGEFNSFVDKAVEWSMRMECGDFLGRARENRLLDRYTDNELEEYFWNSKLANISMLQILASDAAFFGTRENLYNYLSGLNSEQAVLDSSTSYDGVQVKGYENTEIRVGGSNIAYRSMESYRDLMIMSGQWTDNMEAAYRNYLDGKLSLSDHRIMFRPIRTSVRSFTEVSDGVGGFIKAPVVLDNTEFPVFTGKGVSASLESLGQYIKDNSIDIVRFHSSDRIGMPAGISAISSSGIAIQDTDVGDSAIDSTLRETDKFRDYMDDSATEKGESENGRFSQAYKRATDLLDNEQPFTDALRREATENGYSDRLSMPFSDPVSTMEVQRGVMKILSDTFSGKKVLGARLHVISDSIAGSDLGRIKTESGFCYEALVPQNSETKIRRNSLAVGYAVTDAGSHLAIPLSIKGFLPVSAGPNIVLPGIKSLRNVTAMDVYYQTKGDFTGAFKAAQSFTASTAVYDNVMEAVSFLSGIIRSAESVSSMEDTISYQKEANEKDSAVRSAAQHDISSRVTADLSFQLTMMGENRSGLNSSVSLFADAINEPGIAKALNITPLTADTAMTLARLGYTPKQIGIYLNQPVIKDFTQAYSDYGSPRDIDYIMDRTIATYLSRSGKEGINLVSTDFDMSEADMLKVISKDSMSQDDYLRQALLGRKFKDMFRAAADIGLIAEADSLPLIAETALGQLSNDAAQEVKRQIIYSQETGITSESVYWNVNSYSEQTTGLDGRLEKLFPQYGGNVLAVVSDIFSRSAYDGRVTDEMIDDVINEMSAYVLSAGKDGHDTYSAMKAQLNDFPAQFQDIVDANPELADNALVKAISLKGGIYRPYLSLSEKANPEEMTAAWDSLAQSSPLGAKLASDLFSYSIRQGFREGSLASLAPASVRASTPAYVEGLNALSRIATGSSSIYEGIPEVLQQFGTQYMLNHLDEVSSPVDVSHNTLFIYDGQLLPEVQLNMPASYNSSYRDIIRSHDTILDDSTGITYERNNFYDFLKVTNGREIGYYRHTDNGSYYMTRSLGGHVLEYMPGFDASAVGGVAKAYIAPAKTYDMDAVQAIRITEPRVNNLTDFNSIYARMTSPFGEGVRDDSDMENYEDNDSFLDADGKPICR